MRKLIVFACLVCLLFSCQPPGVDRGQADKQLLPSDEQIALEPGGAIVSYVRGPFCDESGQVWIKMHCAWGYGRQNSVRATVDPDEVLVGGGAYIISNDANGGLLTASYPAIDYVYWPDEETGIEYADTWVAESKDHTVASSHTLCVFAIGMKLRYNQWSGTWPPSLPQDFISKTTMLEQYIRYNSAFDGTPRQHPTVSVSAPAGFSLLSGGARILNDPNQPGNYLTGNYGVREFGSNGGFTFYRSWCASAKDHLVASTARIQACAISLITSKHNDATIPNFGDLDVRNWDEWSGPSGIQNYAVRWQPSVTTSASAYGEAWMDNIESFGEFVIVGAGARTEWNWGYGRMLTSIYPMIGYPSGNGSYPINQFLLVRDNYYGNPDPGTLHSQMIVIRKDTPESQD